MVMDQYLAILNAQRMASSCCRSLSACGIVNASIVLKAPLQLP